MSLKHNTKFILGGFKHPNYPPMRPSVVISCGRAIGFTMVCGTFYWQYWRAQRPRQSRYSSLHFSQI